MPDQDPTAVDPSRSNASPADATPFDTPAGAEAADARLAAAEQEAADLRDQLLRLRAEMDNLRKRQQRELDAAHKYAGERFASELLPVRDSMELGWLTIADDAADITKVREGYELTIRQLDVMMEKVGLEPVDPEGLPFDPERHQAMATEPSAELAPNTVVKVYQKGWLLHDRLLRPAMVVVSTRP
ncbi:MAG: nucleotide exchange factor GrpE [Chromatiales bacterium]|nr:nucleotide exchange factor GrpE [Chromatiales bacterium]